MIHNHPGQSSYFQGKFAIYGRHQWNIKTYALDDDQLAELREYFLDGIYLQEEFGVNINDVTFEGRSGGWLVVDADLHKGQIEQITDMVESFQKDPVAFYKSIFE